MPPKSRLEDLRNHLFETLESLRDEEKPMEIERALAVSNVAQAIIDSAKIELKFIELTGDGVYSRFLSSDDVKALPGTNAGKTA